jgi:hypothetical protein
MLGTDFKETLEPGEIDELRHESSVQDPKRRLADLYGFPGAEVGEVRGAAGREAGGRPRTAGASES